MKYSTELSMESQEIIADLANLYALYAKLAQKTPFDINAARKGANNFFLEHSGILEEIENVENFFIKNQNDEFQIPVRLYRVNNKNEILLFIHGGGWIQGNLDTHDYLCRKIAKIFAVNVLAVDYRLAPEHTFPMPLDDVASIFDWCSKKYEKIYAAGDSGGGNLCAALCIKNAEKNRRKPDALTLFYPALGNNFRTKSFEIFENISALSRAGVIKFYSCYSGKKYDIESVLDNKLLAPILETDMSVFPKTFIASAGCDVLLTEQFEFAEKMRAAGNDCQQIILDGAVHGFMTYGREFDRYNTEILQKISEWL